MNNSGACVSGEEYLYFVERALRGMLAIVTELGDARCCSRAELPGANSAFGLLTHCLGVTEYWSGRLVAGREVDRDRLAEFEAAGTIAQIRARVDEVTARLAEDVGTARWAEPLLVEPEAWSLGPDRTLTQGGALLHLLEELSQHHGQMEVLRDTLVASKPAEPFAAPLSWLRAKQGVKWHRPGPDLLPSWVADMDFPVDPAVREAIQRTIDRGDLGYPDWSRHPLADAFADRMDRLYGWRPDPAHVRGVTDLIQALQITIQLATRPGQAIVAHVPNYPPFLATLSTMQRDLLPVQLEPAGEGWGWDHDRLETALTTTDAAVVLLVNPHNPTGRVFTREELEAIADTAQRHDLVVISDEIHAELAYEPHRHIPFASLGVDVAARTITVTSAGKAFNIAGLRTAVAHVGPAAVRAAWDAQPPDLFGATNVLGVEATLAAWSDGDEWLAGLRAQLRDRRDALSRRLAPLPGVRFRAPEASYLAWLDCRETGLADPAAHFRAAGVELSPGPDFGPGGEGFARLNFATTDEVLSQIVDRLAGSLG